MITSSIFLLSIVLREIHHYISVINFPIFGQLRLIMIIQKVADFKFTTFCLILVIIPFVFVESISFEKDVSLTYSQKQALDKFKAKVKPLLKHEFMKNDIYLIRWLRARDYDIMAAETMLKENLKWRATRRMDTIHKEDFSDIFMDFPTSIDTYTKKHAPIGVVDIFDWNIREAVLTGRGQRVLRYLDMLMDNLTMQVYERQKAGYNVTQWTVLANANNFGMATHACPNCIPLWIQFVISLENNYVGWLDELIVIEATPAVQTILEILRPFLSRQTRESLKIFGQNKSKWGPYLDAKINRSERREQYAGTKPPLDRY